VIGTVSSSTALVSNASAPSEANARDPAWNIVRVIIQKYMQSPYKSQKHSNQAQYTLVSGLELGNVTDELDEVSRVSYRVKAEGSKPIMLVRGMSFSGRMEPSLRARSAYARTRDILKTSRDPVYDTIATNQLTTTVRFREM
jgi:hypothetical protein